MSKLIILQGLPGSGKTTYAQDYLKKSGNAVRVNKDLLRTMLHFDKWTGLNEDMTKKAEWALIRYFLQADKNVVVDDTNLNPKIVESLKQVANEVHASVELVDLEASVEDCILRDSMREKMVGKEVIYNMARQYGLFDNEKMDVIVDMDGTLADCTHRQHYVQGDRKDWKGFFSEMAADIPRQEVVDLVTELSESFNIVVVSARPEDYKIITTIWLKHYGIPYQTLIMRRSGDTRPDEIVKQEILNRYFKKGNIKLVIDDRPKVIRMWRSNGLEVRDVGQGEEF